MTATELEAYLHTHIPLSAAMSVQVPEASGDLVELCAPLPPNVNHRGTVFGGSISALAILAGWCLLRTKLDGMDPLPHIVIQRNTMDYLRPVTGAFRARAAMPPQADWPAFLASLRTRGRARIALIVEVFSEIGLTAKLDGTFVALKV